MAQSDPAAGAGRQSRQVAGVDESAVKQLEDGPEPARGASDSSTGDHLANERRPLAWARTGIAAMGLGFIVAPWGAVACCGANEVRTRCAHRAWRRLHGIWSGAHALGSRANHPSNLAPSLGRRGRRCVPSAGRHPSLGLGPVLAPCGLVLATYLILTGQCDIVQARHIAI